MGVRARDIRSRVWGRDLTMAPKRRPLVVRVGRMVRPRRSCAMGPGAVRWGAEFARPAHHTSGRVLILGVSTWMVRLFGVQDSEFRV